MSHYETLGVKTDASPIEIKRAYRSRAKQSHPDKGGKQSDFEPIVKAYEVLSDPERRLLYDATGQDKHTPIETSVQQLLLTLFHQALATDSDIPIIKTVREQVKMGNAKIPEEIKRLKERRKKLEAKRKKITATGQNVVHMIIDGELTNIAGQIAVMEREQEVAKACLEALDSYTEDWTPPPPPEMQVIFTGFSSGSIRW
jgi:curved DNA-binding protein CbpA